MPLPVWILLVLLALLAALSRLRVGLRAALSAGDLRLEARVGPVRLPLRPDTPGKPAAARPAESGAQRIREKEFSFTKADLPDAVRTLGPPLRRALARARRGVRIRPLRLRVTLGGAEDPAGAAERYGLLCALLGAALPPLEDLADLRDPDLCLGVDYEAAGTAAEGEIGVSLRLGTLLAIALGAGLPALRWLSARRKRPKAPAAQSS